MGMAGRSIGYDEVVPRDLHFKMNTNTVARHWFNGDPWITQGVPLDKLALFIYRHILLQGGRGQFNPRGTLHCRGAQTQGNLR